MNCTRTLLFILISCFATLQSAYFQQQVRYQIDVKLLPELNRLEGREELVYFNQSPDTLDCLYFNLYLNRFRGEKNKKVGYTEIISLSDAGGNQLCFQVGGTVMKLFLSRPLLPGDSAVFNCRFNTVLPISAERFGYRGDHFDVGNWYPVPAVYDADGWHAEQHVGGEFYQEWGDYRVNISVPRGYVVAATGELLNPEVLPDSVEFENRKIDYFSFDDTSMVTYRFRAKRVHDFAWCANPEFTLKRLSSGKTELRYFLLRNRQEEWLPQLEKGRIAIEVLEAEVGPYPYSTLSVVDGYVRAGGIEYPGLVIINDYISNPKDLSATIGHEIAHQWFYGLLANNQTRYGWMDEGFATYYENLIMEKAGYGGADWVNSPSGFWGRFFGYQENIRQGERLYFRRYSHFGEEEPVNRHFDWYRGNPYLPTYQKMSLTLSQLHYLLGDSLFHESIQHYYRNWHFRHPQPRDLFAAFESVSGRDLDWFFDEWLETTWHCDYSLKKVQGAWVPGPAGKTYHARFVFGREKDIVMPLDFRVWLKNGEVLDYRIPVAAGSNFYPESAGGISPWPFNQTTRKVELAFPAEVARVKINPNSNMLDENPFNDSSDILPPVRLHWLSRQYLFPHTDAYTVTAFPHLFFNDADGVQAGIRTRGNFIYPNYQHRATILFGNRSLRPEVNVWIEHPVYAVNRRLHFVGNGYYAAGRWGGGAWLQWVKDRRANLFRFTGGWEYRRISDSEAIPFQVSIGKLSLLNAVVSAGHWDRGFLPQGWEINLHTETDFFGSDFTYRKWLLVATARLPVSLGQKLTGELRLGGLSGNPPPQKKFRFGGAETFDFFSSPYYRRTGIVPAELWRQGHLFVAGGGNLRSMAGIPGQAAAYLVASNAHLTLGNPLNLTLRYVPYLSDLMISVFTDWAALPRRLDRSAAFSGEAGFSISLTRLSFLLNFMDIDQVHLDFPVWVNRRISDSSLKWRWVLRMDFRSFQ